MSFIKEKTGPKASFLPMVMLKSAFGKTEGMRRLKKITRPYTASKGACLALYAFA